MATTCPSTTADILIRDVRVVMPSVTDEMVRLELFNTVRDFCLTSLSVRADTKDTLAAGDTQLVMADTEDGLEVIKVLSLQTQNGRLRPMPQLRIYQSPIANDPVTGLAGYWCDAPNSVRFYSPPAQDIAIAGVVAVAPKASCQGTFSTLPEVLYTQHYEAIRAGTLGRLYMQPGKPYSNIQMSRIMMGRAGARSIWARVNADQADTMGDAPWRYPRNFV